MVSKTGITRAIINLNEAHGKFSLVPTDDPQFFKEWLEPNSILTEQEKATLDSLKSRYLYYANEGAITEGTVNIIILSPLLELLGLCDPPFKIFAEKYVQLEIPGQGSQEPALEGYIDALIIQNYLWIILIESKRYGFSVRQALPQTLAYMAANPDAEQPVFALITTGEDYLFVKLALSLHQYALSNKFTLSNPQTNELYTVVQIIKQIVNL